MIKKSTYTILLLLTLSQHIFYPFNDALSLINENNECTEAKCSNNSLKEDLNIFFHYYNDYVERTYNDTSITDFITFIIQHHAPVLKKNYSREELKNVISAITKELKLFLNSQLKQNIIDSGASFFSCDEFHNKNNMCFQRDCYTSKYCIHQNRSNIKKLLKIFQSYYYLLYPSINKEIFEKEEIITHNNFLAASANIFCNNLKKNSCHITEILKDTHLMINNFIFLEKNFFSFFTYYSPKMLYKRLLKYKKSEIEIIATGALYQYLIKENIFNWDLLQLEN